MENIKDLKQLLSMPKDIVITTHRNPDGDAVGSSLGLFHYLNQLGHSTTMIAPSDFPHIFAWMPQIHDIMIYDNDPEASKKVVEKADIIFCLDYNALERIDRLGEIIAPLKATKVMIDHHLYPEPFPDFTLSDTSASSTCELVFDFIEMLGDKGRISPRIGECLFTGILTDTGSFKFGTSPKLFRVVAQLLEIGVDDYTVQDLVFNCLTEKHLRLLGHCLYNRMEIVPEYQTAIITLTKEDYAEFDISRGDTEGIVNYALKMKKIKVAAFITEQPTIVKLSLRSKGDFSVQEIAKKYFRGGGHKNASGGASFFSLAATVRKFKELLPKYAKQLAVKVE